MPRKRRFALSAGTTPHLRLVRVPRRFARVTVDIAAQYTVVGEPRRFAATIDDLGGGGVRLHTYEDLAAGTLIALRFDVAGGRIDATARVAMSLFDARRGQFIHGVAFTAIDAAAQAAIIGYVDALCDSPDDRGSSA